MQPLGNRSVSIDAIIFDLDGTLVDSADGILTSFAGAFQICGRSLTRPLTHDVIGPPLETTLRLLVDSEAPEVIDPLAAAFKAYYDETGYRATKVYSGVSEMLQYLKKNSLPAFIATNKRKRPADAIVDWLNWRNYFKAVYAIDSLQPPAPTKGELIKYILTTYQLQAKHTLYVGDRDEDLLAATETGVHFYRATWGYGERGINATNDSGIQKLLSFLDNRCELK